MVTFGIDAHKRSHTIVAVDEAGKKLGELTTKTTTTRDHLRIVKWAAGFGSVRLFAVEDCRHLSRRLEADLLAGGESIVRVPPKLMAHCRDSARTYGESDPIDALAVARAALRHPDLLVARLDGPSRQVRLLVDHREDLIAENTRHINRLRWHLHELDPSWDPPARSLRSIGRLNDIAQRLAALTGLGAAAGLVAEIAAELVDRIIDLTGRANQLDKRISALVADLAPTLLAMPGCGALTAAKIVGETAGVDRFKSKDAFARHNGTAPLPVWSGNKHRHRLSRTGNRQLNAAIHRIAVTQIRMNDDAKAYMAKRITSGNTKTEALRARKRRLSDIVYRRLETDHHASLATCEPLAA